VREPSTKGTSREGRGAEGDGNIGVRVWKRGVSFPIGEESVSPPQIFLTFELKMVRFGAFWMLFFIWHDDAF